VSCADVTNSEAAGSELRTTAVQPSVEKPVILLVEDEPLVRKVTCEVLQSAGYRVLKAKNTAEAIHTFSRHGEEIDLLLTDVVMPGRSGRELARELRGICSDLKTIFTSG
jgi:two-component system, cell cycle sensor histidine kinase and response regulator CckA